MKPIDFDGNFSRYMERFVAENRKKYKNADALEAALPDVYMRWLNQRADWLDGETPGTYFLKYDSAEELIALMREYDEAGVSLPNLLLERISDLGETAAEPLAALAFSDAPDDMRLTALNLLKELGGEVALDRCVRLVAETEGRSDLCDVAAELLSDMGARAREAALSALDGATDSGREALLDVLSNFPGDDRVYERMLAAFLNEADKRALYASYLGKLGDDRAIAPLTKALELTELNYLDYIEIAGAIEALGGEVAYSRAFDGDPYYESLKKLI